MGAKSLDKKAFLNGLMRGLASPCMLFGRSKVSDIPIPEQKAFKPSSTEDDAKKIAGDFRKAFNHVR